VLWCGLAGCVLDCRGRLQEGATLHLPHAREAEVGVDGLIEYIHIAGNHVGECGLSLHMDLQCFGRYGLLVSGFWICGLCVLDVWCLNLGLWCLNLDLLSLGLWLDLWCLGLDGPDA